MNFRNAVFFVCLIAAPAAFAQVDAAAILKFMDRDGDGAVSLNDYLNVQLPKLARFDADGDGMLNFEEFKASLDPKARQNATRSFQFVDTEGAPRKLNQREFLGYHAFIFQNFLDTNHDGTLSEKEWTRLLASLN